MPNKTHYENLKVARDAPSDVIRAAYKALSQKYSSDRNPNADAQKLMEIISASNSVLSNPVKRAEYDQWLLGQESASAEKKASAKKAKLKKISEDFDDGKEIIIGKESDVHAYEKGNNAKRWLLYAAVGLTLIAVLGWFGFADEGTVTDGNDVRQVNRPEKIDDRTSQSKLADSAAINETGLGATRKPDITSIDVPAHDKASLDKFVGIWQNNASAGRQSLDISKKSANAIVFRLDAKTSEGTGGVYGIAEYRNNYAVFFNQEYDCLILFTIKSSQLKITTTSCQEYHGAGVVFDGVYNKPQPLVAAKPAAIATAAAKPGPEIAIQPPAADTPPAIVKNAPKLYKFSAKVRDADGNVSEIELIAKDKDAARAIIRDFRGNPEVLKIKQLKK